MSASGGGDLAGTGPAGGVPAGSSGAAGSRDSSNLGGAAGNGTLGSGGIAGQREDAGGAVVGSVVDASFDVSGETSVTDAVREAPVGEGAARASDADAGEASLPSTGVGGMDGSGGARDSDADAGEASLPSTGAGGMDGSIPPVCALAGGLCPTATECCTGETCIQLSGANLCAANCTDGTGCTSGCCAPVINSSQHVCAPATNCPSPPAEEGTVLAADLTGKLLIQTTFGPALFSGIGCFGVNVGSRVSFASSAGACVTNQITVVGTQTACSVFCDGSGYPGVVVSATNFSAFVISTLFGNQPFTAQGVCVGVLAGDNVVFTDFTGACAINSFADVRGGQFCNVFCN